MDCSCGQPFNATNEISGGKEAKAHEFPWIVRLVSGCPGMLLFTKIFGSRI